MRYLSFNHNMEEKVIRKNSRFKISPPNSAEDVGFEEYDAVNTVDESKSQTLQLLADTRHQLSRKRILDLMEERAQEGLSQPLPSSNKGFQLLMKLGFDKERGLGKDNIGHKDPVSLNIRSSRDHSGLGIVDEKTAKRTRNEEEKREREAKYRDQESSFRIHTSKQYTLAQLVRDIKNVQKVIEELDASNNIPAHRLSVSSGGNRGDSFERTDIQIKNSYMYDPLEDALDSDDEDDDHANTVHCVNPGKSDLADPSEELLTECLEYLRHTHLYCYYCGSCFDSPADLEANCPGLSRDCH